MLKERGVIVEIEPNALWIETIQASTCGSCVAKKGCGQRLLAKVGAESMRIRVIKQPDDRHQYQLNQSVEVAIPDNIIVSASLFVYLLPLLLLVAFSSVVNAFALGEVASMIGGLVGFIVGGLLIRYHSEISKNNPKFQPILLDSNSIPEPKEIIFSGSSS